MLDPEYLLIHTTCMQDGDGGGKQKTSPSSKGRSGTHPSSSASDAIATCSGEKLEVLVKRLQSDVDKLKHIEHKRRELAQAVTERRKAEEAAADKYSRIHWSNCSASSGRESKQL